MGFDTGISGDAPVELGFGTFNITANAQILVVPSSNTIINISGNTSFVRISSPTSTIEGGGAFINAPNGGVFRYNCTDEIILFKRSDTVWAGLYASGGFISGVTSGGDRVITSRSGVTEEKYEWLGNVTSDIQAQLDGKEDALRPANRVDAGNVATGVVNNTEFNHLNGVQGPIQVQINSKQDTITPTNRISASGIASGNVSDAEFDFLNGVGGPLQGQINAKQNQITPTNRVNAGHVGTGVVSDTEFSYLNGATSNIQNQINSISGRTVVFNRLVDNRQASTSYTIPSGHDFVMIAIDWANIGWSYHLTDVLEGITTVSTLPSDMFTSSGNNLFAAEISLSSSGVLSFNHIGFKNMSSGSWTERRTNSFYKYNVYSLEVQ